MNQVNCSEASFPNLFSTTELANYLVGYLVGSLLVVGRALSSRASRRRRLRMARGRHDGGIGGGVASRQGPSRREPLRIVLKGCDWLHERVCDVEAAGPPGCRCDAGVGGGRGRLAGL